MCTSVLGFYHVVLEGCQTMKQHVENFYASIRCTVLKTRKISILSMKMVLIRGVNTVYR